MADKIWNNSVVPSFFQIDTTVWWALLHTEGRRDVTKLIGAFIKHYLPQKTPKKQIFSNISLLIRYWTISTTLETFLFPYVT